MMGPPTMSSPSGFTWVEKPHLAALGRPSDADAMAWLRRQGIELLIALTEDPPRRDWINDAGLLLMHVPVEDMEAPTQVQLDRCISAIERANAREMGVAVHCGAGLGRTGVILAAYFVAKGMSAQNAIGKVRRMRPGSIETDEQADAVVEFARRHGQQLNEG
jgi:atypical dual specificity phosphatase